ncbi:YitT family protein [Kutzneria buriramensis]|uniref:Putative membrane protein YczE n=1 Tax=Kutzneria buriramensis TaxID=1045776 RepID=A0A3E0GXT4_9PSEU|nr:hypothetical protein [Kutzneria buriramensis]REH31084.1 putative membrane protein YczE [Kutzneria buriramensis]
MRRLNPTPFVHGAQTVFGAAVMGTGLAATYQARLGVQPWDVLHQALANLTGLTAGEIIVLVSVVTLAMWWPLRQRPGLGTVVCTLVPGPVMDFVREVLPAPDSVLPRIVLLVTGIALFAVGTALLIRARLGPGVRDGLMTGACGRWGWPIGVVRAGLEFGVLLLGLGVALLSRANVIANGSVGLGTLAIALALGPLLHVLLGRRRGAAATEASAPGQV